MCLNVPHLPRPRSQWYPVPKGSQSLQATIHQKPHPGLRLGDIARGSLKLRDVSSEDERWSFQMIQTESCSIMFNLSITALLSLLSSRCFCFTEAFHEKRWERSTALRGRPLQRAPTAATAADRWRGTGLSLLDPGAGGTETRFRGLGVLGMRFRASSSGTHHLGSWDFLVSALSG